MKIAMGFFGDADHHRANGNLDYAIELYLNGLDFDPDNIDAHNALRAIALARNANGAASLGMFETAKLSKLHESSKQQMLNAEKLLAYDPLNIDHMLVLARAAEQGEYHNTAAWIKQIIDRTSRGQ